VGGMAGEAALLAVARSTSADVALGGQRMAVRSRRRDRSAAGVARPARRMERLHAGAGAERVVRTATGKTTLGIGPDARALVASDAERLCAVAGRAVGHVAARVDRMQGNVVGRVDVGRAHDAAVAVDAIVALVARQAVALFAAGDGVVTHER